MRITVWLILLFAAAVVAATALGQNDGLVTVAWRSWRVELSLNLTLFLLVVAGVAGFAVLRALEVFLSLPRRAGEWRALQRERTAHAALRDAFSAFFAGRYSRAQKDASKAMALVDQYPDLPISADHRVLSLILAAGSRHRLQDRAGRDALLTQIQQTPPAAEARTALEGGLLLGAEWALDDSHAERAEALLESLPAGVTRRTLALRLRLKAARQSRRTRDALEMARLLAKHQAFSATASTGLLRTLALEHLDAARDADQLLKQWQQLNLQERRDSIIVSYAVRKALTWASPDVGRQLLDAAWDELPRLDAESRSRVVLSLASCVQGAGPAWLERAEAAARAWPADPAVAFTAGVVCVEQQLWGKARQWLEPAASHANLTPVARRQAWRLLARMARQEGKEDKAAACDASALALESSRPVIYS